MKSNLLIVCFLLSCCLKMQAQTDSRPGAILKTMEKVADWQLMTWEIQGMRKPKWDWTNGASYAGFMALNSVANDSKYLNAMKSIGESMHWNSGPHRTMADDYCVGQLFAQMYSLYRDSNMISGFQAQADSIASGPHDESLEWKNDIQLREWAWCDALFMGPPALAYLTTATGDRKYLDLAARLWWKTTDYLYDSSEHLYSRDGRYLKQKEANGRKMFWSRGNGWVMGGLVRMLENMPVDYPDRGRFIDLFKKMAATIASVQHADGSWHAALLDSIHYPVKETSGTGFYCYALAWGVNHGLLSYSEYSSVILKAWNSLASSVHSDGKLGYVQQIGEKPESVDSNSTEVYGVGAFLLAGSEMIQLVVAHSREILFASLYNPCAVARKEEIAVLPADTVRSLFKEKVSGKFSLFDALTGDEIPYQWEYRGKENPVNILVQVSITAGTKLFLKLSAQDPAVIKPKTYARYVPERLDDFAWENDRIAYRMYGKGLEGSKDDGYGLDVWVKRTQRMILNERYKRGEYHIDHGDGLDYYHVGYSLGAGNIAPYFKDSIWYSKNYHRWKLLDNGPLRSTFQLVYDWWNADGMPVMVTKTISLDAGSQLSRIEAVFNFGPIAHFPIVVGIVKRAKPGTVLLDERQGIMAYWEPTDQKDGTTGVGCVFTEVVQQMLTGHGQFLTQLSYSLPDPIIYYTGAVWDKAGLIRSAKEWFEYLQDFRDKINHPLEILWK